HTTTGCGKQGFPSAQPYLSHTPGANPFCCMFFVALDCPFVLQLMLTRPSRELFSGPSRTEKPSPSPLYQSQASEKRLVNS
ncbi:hypothetical protein BO72DRAFT_371844, partial [Aspergillus fijiensis CBS 313.89]